MSRGQCLDIDRWYLCTSIDINLHLSRHLLVTIDSTGCASIDCSSSRRPLRGQLGECFTLGVSIIGCKDFRQVSGAAGSVTKIGQASINQNLMVVATKFCSLLFDIYPRNSLTILGSKFRERKCDKKSTPGVTFQTYLKNPIPCIPSPKTSGYVRFSVGNQLWLFHTVQG
ncbi:hypothetical protein IGI04_015740, partial [Brassica rapa subsp. trilocularis]